MRSLLSSLSLPFHCSGSASLPTNPMVEGSVLRTPPLLPPPPRPHALYIQNGSQHSRLNSFDSLVVTVEGIRLYNNKKKKKKKKKNSVRGGNRDYFYNLLTAQRTVSKTYAPVARAQPCANLVQHVERLSRATCRVPRGKKGQLSC